MPDVRILRIRALWANNAPIPPGESAIKFGEIYKWDMMSAEEDEIKQWEGQPFFIRSDSARWNGALYTMTSLVQLIERWGIMPWAIGMNYQQNSLAMSPNGTVYRARQNHLSLLSNNPDTPGGASFWINFVHSEQMQSDWLNNDTTSPAYIWNKPAMMPPAPGGGPWAGQGSNWVGIPCQCNNYNYNHPYR